MDRASRWRAKAGEALVIVASILIAFAIEAWWSDRQEAQAVTSLVDLLIQDIESDLVGLQRQAERSDTLLAKNDRLLQAALGTLEAPAVSELPELSETVWSTSQIDPSLSAYEIVRGSDAWNRIPPSVKVSLSEYMRGPFSVDRALDLEAVRHLIAVVGRHDGVAKWWRDDLDQDVVASAVLGFLRDPETQVWLVAHRQGLMGESMWQQRWLDELPALAEEIRALR